MGPAVNRQYQPTEADQPQTQTFDAGLEFIATNRTEDRWFLQIETFDPHEPFYTHEPYKRLYPHSYDGPHFDWPDYKPVTETAGQVAHLRYEYAALLSMCDHNLGRVLDTMDTHNLWDDTMLIVCTDHGFLLGEHEWWGKSVQPWYDETIHTPLFVWDPRTRAAGERRSSLVQTVDIGPTLLEYFGVDRTDDMTGIPLRDTVADDTPVRDAGLFGSHGGHVSVTDGRHVYMRACATPDNQPLYDYTLMPTHMKERFRPQELHAAEFVPALPFTKDVRVLRIPATSIIRPHAFGTLLFDLAEDPDQQTPLVDDDLELRMAALLVDAMRAADAPAEQYTRLGLPAEGPVTAEHLLIRTQWPQVQAAAARPRAEDYPAGPLSVHTPIRELLGDAGAERVLRRHLSGVLDSPLFSLGARMTPLELASGPGGPLTREGLDTMATELAGLQVI